MLKLNNICVNFSNQYSNNNILNNLDLNISHGEFVVIIGGNGAGKSTLFNVISGAISNKKGQIILGGVDISKKSEAFRSKKISKVIQNPNLGTIGNMSIYENMAFAYKRGCGYSLELFDTEYRRKLFAEKLSEIEMGLEHRMDELVCNLSGGQKQLLSLVMSMLNQVDLILLDEITAALDPCSSDIAMSHASKIIKSKKTTCLMITHNMDHAILYGDRLLILKNGSFIQEYSGKEKNNLSKEDLIYYI